jgi:hypothetical protein
MSEARLELVETKQVRQFAFDIVMGVLGMDESDMDDQAYASEQVEGWMEHWEKSRRVMSIPTEEMVEAAAMALFDETRLTHPDTWETAPERSREVNRGFVRVALTAAFNILGIQEKVDT